MPPPASIDPRRHCLEAALPYALALFGLGASAAWKARYGPDMPRGIPYVEILAALGLFLGWIAAIPAAARAALAYWNGARSKPVLLSLLAASAYFLVGLAIPAFST